MDYWARAQELADDTIANRRHIHQHAEVGLDLPMTKAYVMEKLKEYGLDPKECGHGVTATLGKPGKCILLRADMDALPMAEESGEPFACASGQAAHTCGHDFHTAMLLTAARMLKESEQDLEGTVKFMFQPGEETFQGSRDMIENGILENPRVDVALGYHVSPGKMPIGLYMYNNKTNMMFSVDGFCIKITGRGGHGAYPHMTIDPLNIAVNIYQALEAIIAREADPAKACVMTIGKIEGGTAPNLIPETAVLEGTIRTNDAKARELLVRRMQEVSKAVATTFGGQAEVEMLYEVPNLVCDPALTDEILGYMQAVGMPNAMPYPGVEASASEDFACIAEKVPSVFMYLSAGYLDDRGQYMAHNPKAQFNEAVCPIGSAYYAHCAAAWLKNNQ